MFLQERLEDHPALTALTGSCFLQTIRAATLINGAGAPELIYTEWKVIAGSHVIDNFRRGSTGNLICNVAVATGRLSAARRPSADGVGMEMVAAHPITGHALEGFRLPYWQELVALVKRCVRRPRRRGARRAVPRRSLTARPPPQPSGTASWQEQPHDVCGMQLTTLTSTAVVAGPRLSHCSSPGPRTAAATPTSHTLTYAPSVNVIPGGSGLVTA